MIKHQYYFHGPLMILTLADEDIEKEEMQEADQVLCEPKWPQSCEVVKVQYRGNTKYCTSGHQSWNLHRS